MTLQEIILSIDQDNSEIRVDWLDLTGLAGEFDIWDSVYEDVPDADKRMKAYMISVNYCTDTWVGTNAWFLDGEFVCISKQPYRKSSEDFEFLDERAFNKCHEFIRSLTGVDTFHFNTLDLNAEMGETYTQEYTNNILHDSALYNGEVVKIHQKMISYSDPSSTWSDADIEHADGRRETVKCYDLQIKYLQPIKTWSKPTKA